VIFSTVSAGTTTYSSWMLCSVIVSVELEWEPEAWEDE
jgi:hypothetical protein